jgi:hypothetical protein
MRSASTAPEPGPAPEGPLERNACRITAGSRAPRHCTTACRYWGSG